MHILFEAIRVNHKHGMLITYEKRLHARHGASTLSGGTSSKIFHPRIAAPFSCQQHPDDYYKDAFQTY